MINGGCFCGAIRYQIDEDDLLVANCHCTMCRRTSGAPYVTWLIVHENNFRYTQGTPKLLKSSDEGTRFFCSDCGTPIVCQSSAHPERVDITLGSLDHPEKYTPTMEGFTDTRLPWV